MIDPAPQSNLTRHPLAPRELRWARLDQRPVIAWLTGLPGAGKSTIAAAVDRSLIAAGRHSAVLDGDNLRRGLNADLTFTPRDRSENVRRAAEVARLMAETGTVVIVSLISPSRSDRAMARRVAGDIPFLEVFVDTPLSICVRRDPKGLYARASRGQVAAFTGVSAPYEAPEAPDLALRTEGLTVMCSAAPLCEALLRLSASAS
ncbi:adenylyl-sulfate kinase [Methylobacterium sp. E-005]|uniref:adenylyl-sulfate kinase n=1 Tax=Methylobacterium sp. E-005 TaxID=2836549 RepID=UPI001FBB6EDD|nr:adenylyl-sulfate kinase [Methylobacterium sp. E-005]MCJ2088119.1 adenylyl-sulfate kinase [Methylobacterium sp. E-005]